MNLPSTALRSFLFSSAIALTAAAQPPEEAKKAPAGEPPATWEMALGEKAQPLWDRFRTDGKVTAAEVIAANREYGEAHDGEAQAATAWLLMGLQHEDPIPVLREMMKDPDAEVCAFAVSTAGALGDVRLEGDLDALAVDKREIGMKKESRFAEGTIADLVEEALEDIVRGGVLSGDREEGSDIDIPAWMKFPPPASPELDTAMNKIWKTHHEAMEAANTVYRKGLAEALSTATEVEVLLLDPNMKKADTDFNWEYSQPRDRFPIMPYGQTSKIFQRRTLTAEEVKALMPSLKTTVKAEDRHYGAMCHFPIHGLRIYNGEDNGRRKIVFQTSICYMCQNFYIAIDHDAGWVGLTSKEFQEVMERLMPIPQEMKDAVLKPEGK